MTLQIIRWSLVAISIGIVVVAHCILVTVQRRRDGSSQWALARFFSALRLYGVMLMANFVVNAISGRSNTWALMPFVLANLYMLYTLVAFWVLLRRGRRLP